MLSLCMFCSTIECACYYVKLKLRVQLAIYRKEVHCKCQILDLFQLKDIVPEFLFVAMHPSPFLVGMKMWFWNDRIENMVFYHINDLLCIIMSIKWSYITSLIIFRSEYANSRSNRVCNMFGTKCDSLFIIKCLLKENPFRYVFGTLLAGILVFANILMISESPLDRIISKFTKHTFSNACWSAICTMTSVGYGDIYPRTMLGRLIAFICS